MSKDGNDWPEVQDPTLHEPQKPSPSEARPKESGSWVPWWGRKNKPQKPGGDGTGSPDRNQEPAERPATSAGPQLCALVVDHSGSMGDAGKTRGATEKTTKAEEATRVLREVIQYAHSVNAKDTTGTKIYFYTQIVLFAERLEDSTNGMSRPPVEFLPEEAYTVRHPKSPERLGNRTNFQLPLMHVHKTLKQGMTKERLKAAMPAPIVLFITDGKPNLPDDEETARRLAIQEANRLKSLLLPAAQRVHPTRERTISYDETHVRLITIGLGDGDQLDQGLLQELCTHVQYKGEDLPLYLHCPEAKDLCKIGTRIIGTVTVAGQSKETLEDAIHALRHSAGA